jgi:ATP-dependent DNA helicase RecG
LDGPLLAREAWPPFDAALRSLHAPATRPDASRGSGLAYDEALAGQLALGLLRRRHRQSDGRPLAGDGRLRAQALAAFGHSPTAAQAEALREIEADLAAPHRMLRLLQGDVGSGKTLVAVLGHAPGGGGRGAGGHHGAHGNPRPPASAHPVPSCARRRGRLLPCWPAA